MSIGACAKTASATPSAGPGRSAMIGGVELSIILSRRGTTVSAGVARTSRPCSAGARSRSLQKKRVSNFDEQSRYVIETKGSGKRTKPNKANLVGGKDCKNGRAAVQSACFISRGMPVGSVLPGFRPETGARNRLTASPCTGIFMPWWQPQSIPLNQGAKCDLEKCPF
jgi:hypothetical protein